MKDEAPPTLPLREFVLGLLEEPRRVIVEERSLTEPDIFEALESVEDTLLEDYVEGRLSNSDRLAFERHFLTTPERRERLAFTRLLIERGAAASRGQHHHEHHPETTLPLWRLGPTSAGAIAASFILTVAVAGWMTVRQATLARQVDLLKAQLAQRSATDASAPTPVSTPEIRLTAGRLRDGGTLTRLSIPAGATIVRIRLMLQAGGRNRYRASLQDADGVELLVAPNLREQAGTTGSELVTVVPTVLLPRGDYQVRVSSAGANPELIDTYNFRVTSAR